MSFPNEMIIFFGGTQTSGEGARTLSLGSFLEELSMQMPSPLLAIGNTQNDVQQETFEDVRMEELMANVRGKRLGPSRSRKNIKNSKFDKNFEHVVIILEEERKREREREERRRDVRERKERRRKWKR